MYQHLLFIKALYTYNKYPGIIMYAILKFHDIWLPRKPSRCFQFFYIITFILFLIFNSTQNILQICYATIFDG